MNTLHFSYAVEVERCGSITQAAENLYMAQPNLSKAIKELEDTMGFAIFSRTSRGVVPTPRGREFLVYAREILSLLRAMEALSGSHDDSIQRLQLCIPRTGYIAECFSHFIDTLDKAQPMDIRICEGSAMRAISDVADGQFNLGVICYPQTQENYFLDYIREKGLKFRTLCTYPGRLLFSCRHPLAARREITAEDLLPYTEIVYGDHAVPYLPAERSENAASRIQVYSRLSSLDLLSRIQDAYMWTAPETAEALKRFALTQRACGSEASMLKDVLIYPASYRFTPLDQRFLADLEAKCALQND